MPDAKRAAPEDAARFPDCRVINYGLFPRPRDREGADRSPPPPPPREGADRAAGGLSRRGSDRAAGGSRRSRGAERAAGGLSRRGSDRAAGGSRRSRLGSERTAGGASRRSRGTARETSGASPRSVAVEPPRRTSRPPGSSAVLTGRARRTGPASPDAWLGAEAAGTRSLPSVICRSPRERPLPRDRSTLGRGVPRSPPDDCGRADGTLPPRSLPRGRAGRAVGRSVPPPSPRAGRAAPPLTPPTGPETPPTLSRVEGRLRVRSGSRARQLMGRELPPAPPVPASVVGVPPKPRRSIV
jgi:hypothetical protein